MDYYKYIENPEVTILENHIEGNYVIAFKFNELGFITGKFLVEEFVVSSYLINDASYVDILKKAAIKKMKEYVDMDGLHLYQHIKQKIILKKDRTMEIE